MKRLASAAFTATFIAAACGGGSSAPGVSSPAAATAANQAAAPAPAATAAATQAASTAAAAPVSASRPARKVALGATNDRYSISSLEVKPGEKIEFVLKNEGDEKHNLVGIGPGVSLVSPDFDSGSTVSWCWTAPTTPMTFKFQCS